MGFKGPLGHRYLLFLTQPKKYESNWKFAPSRGEKLKNQICPNPPSRRKESAIDPIHNITPLNNQGIILRVGNYTYHPLIKFGFLKDLQTKPVSFFLNRSHLDCFSWPFLVVCQGHADYQAWTKISQAEFSKIIYEFTSLKTNNWIIPKPMGRKESR